MADGRSPLQDDEVFFGKNRTAREIAICAALGQNFYSPVPAKRNFPLTLPSALPDIVNGSTRGTESGSSNTDESNFSPKSDLNGTSSVIDLDSDNDSVQIISDNESFLLNEKQIYESDTVPDSGIKSQRLSKHFKETEEINGSDEKENLQPCFSEASNSLSTRNSTPQKFYDSACLPNKSPQQNDTSESSFSTKTSDYMSIEALLAASEHLENNPNLSLEEGSKEPPKENHEKTISQGFSLNSISDSVLNFSHGSSLENSRAEPCQGLLANAVYEDISYDFDQMLESKTQNEKAQPEELDLHMSVDEIDFQVKSFQQCQDTNLSQSTLFESCANNSNLTNYYSVCGSEANHPPGFKTDPSLFSSYRQTVDDSILDGVNQINLDVCDENVNETSFEVFMQTRQNSFPPSDLPESMSKLNKQESSTSKNESKLPVSTHIPILKPSKLQIKPKSTTTNYKWAKSLSKFEIKKPTSTLTVSSASHSKPKVSTPVSKIPTLFASSGSKTNQSSAKKAQTTNSLALAKTGPKTPLASHNLSNKTPTLNSANRSKATETSSHLKPPLKKLCLSDKKDGNNLKDKDRYKNVISPVKAYINRSPALIQRKAQPVKEETKMAMEMVENISKLHAPVKTPKMKHTIVQKLTYGNNQENVAPNYTRDTLPPRSFEQATAVFMKEPDLPKRHLPKIGERMMKLIDTPRPKIIHHEGRVNETPTEKGMLVPNIILTASTPDQVAEASGRISVRVVKALDP